MLDLASRLSGDSACPQRTAWASRAAHRAASTPPGPSLRRVAGVRRAPGSSDGPSGANNHNHGAKAPRNRSTTMAVVTIRQLLDSGVHFGHQTRRWNPEALKRFILTERSGIHIIDLQHVARVHRQGVRVRQENRRARRHHPLRRTKSRRRKSSPSRRPAWASPTSTHAGSVASSPTSRRCRSVSPA